MSVTAEGDINIFDKGILDGFARLDVFELHIGATWF